MPSLNFRSTIHGEGGVHYFERICVFGSCLYCTPNLAHLLCLEVTKKFVVVGGGWVVVVETNFSVKLYLC